MKEGDPYPVDPERIAPGTLVIDVILKPATSPLLAAAQARGCPIQRGIRMLEGQWMPSVSSSEFEGSPQGTDDQVTA